MLHAIGEPAEIALGRTQQYHFTRGRCIVGHRTVAAGEQERLVGGDVLVGIAHAVHQIQRKRVTARCYPSRECQAVNIGMVVLVECKACTIMATEHQLIVAHLTTQGQAHLVGGRGHEKVTIDGSHHFVTRPCVAYRHIDGRLTRNRFLAAQAGLHHDVWIGQVHLGDTHLERQSGDVKLSGGHARSHQMGEHERVHVVSLISNHPLVTRAGRNSAQQCED